MKIANSTILSGIASFDEGARLENGPRCLMAVLTQDAAGLYACYIGMVPSQVEENMEMRTRFEQRIAGSGNKVSWNKLGFFFHDIPQNQYRA